MSKYKKITSKVPPKSKKTPKRHPNIKNQSKSTPKPLKSLKNTKKTLPSRKEAPLNSTRDSIPLPFRSKEFHELQKQWYEKLKESGFEDLEILSWSFAEPEPLMLKSTYQVSRRYNKDVLRHFQRITCFLAYVDIKDKRAKAVLELYAEGYSFRYIIKKINRRFHRCKRPLNLFTLHHLLKKLKQDVSLWNKTNPNGLDFESDITPAWPIEL